jgi:hypothetical protein
MQAVMMSPFADFVEGICALVRWFTSCWRGQPDRRPPKPSPEPEAYDEHCPAAAPTQGMNQHDCYGIAKRLGCSYPGFYGYDREHQEQWVSFTPNLGELMKTAGTTAGVKVHVCYCCINVDDLERQVRHALEQQLQHEIALRRQFLERWPGLTRTAVRTNGCTPQDCKDIAQKLDCRLDFNRYYRDAWELEFDPNLGETMDIAGRTVGVRLHALHALTPAALGRKVRYALRKQVMHEIGLREQVLHKLQQGR